MKLVVFLAAIVLLQVCNAAVIAKSPTDIGTRESFQNYYTNVIGFILMHGYDYQCFMKHKGERLLLDFRVSVNMCVGESAKLDQFWDSASKEKERCLSEVKKINETAKGRDVFVKKMDLAAKCTENVTKYLMDVVEDQELTQKVVDCVPQMFEDIAQQHVNVESLAELKQCYTGSS